MSKVKVFKDFTQDDTFVIKVSHNPVLDITGAVFDVTLKQNPDSTTAALDVSYTVPVGADATNGIAYIPITGAVTSLVSEGDYYGSIKRTIGTSTITVLSSCMPNVDKVHCCKTLKEKVTE